MATNTQDPVNTLGYEVVSQDRPTTQVLGVLEFSDLPYGSIKAQANQPLNVSFGTGTSAYTVDNSGFTIKNPSMVGYVPAPLTCYESLDTAITFAGIATKSAITVTLIRFQDVVWVHIPVLDGVITTAQNTYTSSPAFPSRFWATPTNPTNGQRTVVSVQSLNQVNVFLDWLDGGFIALSCVSETGGITPFPSSDIKSKGILAVYRLASLS